jgi:hypothetical protein
VAVALVPPLGFALQEHLERLIELNAFPYGAALEPTFLVGMALQAPFALGAVLLARAVLAVGHLVGRGVAALRSPRARTRPAAPVLHTWRAPSLARPSLLAMGHCERAPPATAIA